MIKDVLSIRGSKIMHVETGECLALLNYPILNPDTGVIQAFWVKPITLPLKDAILLTSDILAFKKNLYIKSDKVLSDPAEIIRVASLLEDGRGFLNSSVQNEKGKKYGTVYNFTFSTETYVLRQFYTKKSILGLISFDFRVFPQERILKVLPEAVIIEDETTKKEKVHAPSIEPA